MVRLNLRAKRLRPGPLTKRGDKSPKCSKTAQKSCSAISAGRTLFAWERLLRDGGLAPRRLDSGPECNRRASQTSLRPMLWVSCANSSATTWLHGVKVLAFSVTLVVRAILATRNSGIRLQICRNRFNLEPAGMLLLYFFIPAVWQGYAKHSSFFQNPVGWL